MSNWEVSIGHCLESFLNLSQNIQKFSYFRRLKTLKQIFQWESIPCVYLLNIWNRLLAKVCLDALFICLLLFVAFRVTFDGLCC